MDAQQSLMGGAVGRPVFVLGVECSGVETVSEALSLGGIRDARGGFPGGAESTSGDPSRCPLEDLAMDLMEEVDRSFWEPEFAPRLRQRAREPGWRQRAQELVVAVSEGEPWFWSGPDLVSTLPFWLEIFPEPVCLITSRDPRESAKAYEESYLPAIMKGKVHLNGYFFLRWQIYMISILGQVKNCRNKMLIPYRALVSSSQEQCEGISRFLSEALEVGEGWLGGGEQAARVVRPDAWHGAEIGSFDSTPEASAVQKELFAYLVEQGAGDCGDFDASRFPLPELFREYLANIDVLCWLFHSL